MAYQSLYRRYRPATFDAIAGQEHVVAALRNAIREGRTGHAYLFSGPRGTGKTSTARIMAKALNCTDMGDDGEPCNACESCESFLAGTSYDLHELDAASNNGVEAVRDLIAKVSLGSPGRTKVYILDEVHMLTSGAENALLKTLEEPPEHVKFVLATTEPHKVVATIRSRTQHLRFELLPANTLSEYLRWLADDAELGVDDDVIAHVVREGRGSVRDALSALDQVVAAGGIHADTDGVARIVDALAVADSGAAMVAVEDALRSGRDPRVIGESVLSRLRDGFLAAIDADLTHLPDFDRERATTVAGAAGPARLTRSMEVVGTALVDMRQAPDPRIDLEVALLRLTRPDLDTDAAALIERIERLERGAPGTTAAPPPPADDFGATASSATDAAAGGNETVAASKPEVAEPAEASTSPGSEARRTLAAAEAAKIVPGSAAATKPSLGALRGSAATSESPPQPGSTSTPAPAAPPTETDSDREPEAQPAQSEAEPVDSEPKSEPKPEPAEISSDAEPLTRGEVDIEGIWPTVVMPALTKRAKARFQGGSFASSSRDGAIFSLPNQIHRDRCHDVRSEVDSILEAHYGGPVRFELVIGGANESPSAVAQTDESVATPAEPEETIDVASVAGLANAEVEPASHVERLAEVFPGAEIVEPESP